MLAGCGGSSTATPSTAALNGRYVGTTFSVNGWPVTAARLSPLLTYATILPDRHAKSKTFEYIFNEYDTYASIFDYPKSTKEIGTIAGDGGQGCTNVPYGYGKKIFWNVGGPDQITEYDVRKTPIKTLSIPGSFPTSCAMDANGDLAVGIYDGTASASGGDIVIFKNASGSGTVYTTPLDEEFFDGYDNQGNLFADGYIGYRSGFRCRTPKGQQQICNNQNEQLGAVPWLRAVGRHVPHRLRSDSERNLSVYRQRNEGEIEGHCIALGRRLRADLDRYRRCPLRRRGQ